MLEPQRHDPRLEDPPQMLIKSPESLRDHRKAKRMGLREVAEHCGMSHQQIANYELGKTRLIREDVAQRLARFIGFAMEDVFAMDSGFSTPALASCADTTSQSVPA